MPVDTDTPVLLEEESVGGAFDEDVADFGFIDIAGGMYLVCLVVQVSQEVSGSTSRLAAETAEMLGIMGWWKHRRYWANWFDWCNWFDEYDWYDRYIGTQKSNR